MSTYMVEYEDGTVEYIEADSKREACQWAAADNAIARITQVNRT